MTIPIDKKKLIKYIKIAGLFILTVLFIKNCLITNEPDKFTLVFHEIERAKPYFTEIDREIFELKLPYYEVNFTQYTINKILEMPEFILDFNYDFYGHYYNTDYLEMMAYCHMHRPYKKLHIKEIGYILNSRYTVLLKDTTIDVPVLTEENIVLDKNKEPLIVNGEQYYYRGFSLDKKVNHHFVKGFRGEKKEIEIVQIYSFDDEELREEKYAYTVTCGGKKLDPLRMITWMFPP